MITTERPSHSTFSPPRTMSRVLLALCAALLATSPCVMAEESHTAGVSFERVYVDYEIAEDGSFSRTAEVVRRYDTAQGVQQHGQIRLGFQPSRGDAEFIAAHVEQSDGRTIAVDHTRVHLQESYPHPEAAIYTDRKRKSLVLPDLRPGSLASVTSRESIRDPEFPGHFSATEWRSVHFGLRDARIRFTAPASMPLFVEVHDAEVEREELEGKVRWTVSMKVENPWPREALGVAPMDYSPRVAVSSFQDYASFAKTYAAMIDGSRAVTPAIQALADELTHGLDDPLEQARALYEWVAGNIRYVAIHLGRGGWIPHAAQEVLERRYGDCKDHVVLLSALLDAKGIRNTPALVQSGDSWWLPEHPSLQAFNHMIVHLADFDLYLDSTARYADFGVLPLGVSDKTALMLEDGRLVRTSGVSAEVNRAAIEQRLTLSKDGTINGESTVRNSGQLAIIDRAGFAANASVPDAQFVAHFLGQAGEHGTGQLQRPVTDTLGAEVETTLHYTLTTATATNTAGNLPITRGVRFGGIQQFGRMLATETRRSPYLCFASRVEETQHFQLPTELHVTALPLDRSIDSSDPALPYRFSSSYTRGDNGSVIAKRILEFSPAGVVCDASTFPALLALLREIALDYQQALAYAPD